MMQPTSKTVSPASPRRAARAVTNRLGRRLANVLIAAGLAAAGAVPASVMATVPAHAAGFDNAAAETQLIAAINADRAASGLGALMVNSTLSSIARSAPHSVCGGPTYNGRSQDMIERGYFSHQIPPCGNYVWPILNAYGVQYSSAGENIGWNTYPAGTSVSQVNTAFMLSAPHKANILGAYNQVGVGAYMSPGTWNGYSGVIMYTEIFSMGPPPAPAYPQATTADAVGVVGAGDNVLYYHNSAGGWLGMGGTLLAAPAVARSAMVPGGVLFIGTGLDHDLWVRGSGTGWQRLNAGGAVYCNDNPAMTVIGSTLHVGCRGGDNALWYASAAMVPGGLPSVTSGWRSLGGILRSGPAAGEVPGNPTPTFMVEGVDGAVWSTELNNPGWRSTGFKCVGHPALTGSSSGNTYFGCHGADGQVWGSTNNGSGWTGPFPVGGSPVDGIGVSLTAGGANYYYEGPDGQVYEASRSNGSQSVISVVGGKVKYGVGSAA